MCELVDLVRAAVGKAMPEILILSVCVYVCVRVNATWTALPELKELAPDREHTYTTTRQYCVGS